MLHYVLQYVLHDVLQHMVQYVLHYVLQYVSHHVLHDVLIYCMCVCRIAVRTRIAVCAKVISFELPVARAGPGCRLEQALRREIMGAVMGHTARVQIGAKVRCKPKRNGARGCAMVLFWL